MDSLDLNVSIQKVESATMSDGEEAIILYLKVFNNHEKGRKLNLIKATYVKHDREQIEQDLWLSGLMAAECYLKANAFKSSGLVFYKRHLQSVADDDLLYIEIELKKEKKKLEIEFIRNNSNWMITNTEVADIVPELSAREIARQILKRIERLESMEEKCGIYIDKVSFNMDDTMYHLLFEVHPLNGMTIKNDIDFVCILYDYNDNILSKTIESIESDKFYGFEVVKFWDYDPEKLIEKVNQIQKIRIYPKIH